MAPLRLYFSGTIFLSQNCGVKSTHSNRVVQLTIERKANWACSSDEDKTHRLYQMHWLALLWFTVIDSSGFLQSKMKNTDNYWLSGVFLSFWNIIDVSGAGFRGGLAAKCWQLSQGSPIRLLNPQFISLMHGGEILGGRELYVWASAPRKTQNLYLLHTALGWIKFCLVADWHCTPYPCYSSNGVYGCNYCMTTCFW